MTSRKTTARPGRRPALDECLEAWWRVADSPAGRILPDQPRGRADDKRFFCDPFDLYCWRLVGEAIASSRTRGVPATKLQPLVAHVQCGSDLASFKLFEVVRIDPDDPRGFRSRSREVTEIDRLGLDQVDILEAAYRKFRRVLQRTINEAEPYVAPSKIA